jgi:site-specific DNA recombinase
LEGELTDGILDQLARFERTKTAERSRRGKLRKAREGKVIAIHTSNYGFRYNAASDGYEVDEEAMRVVRHIFRMVGSEHQILYAVKRTFEREGIPTPGGARFWHVECIRNYISGDVYKPHTRDEIMAMMDPDQMSAAVAAGLDPAESYGIWWFNRRPTRRTQVSEVGSNGARTCKKGWYVQRPKEEWVAVPVPDSGIPREWVPPARRLKTIAFHRRRTGASGNYPAGDHQVRGVRPQHDDLQRPGPSRQGMPLVLSLQDAQ